MAVYWTSGHAVQIRVGDVTVRPENVDAFCTWVQSQSSGQTVAQLQATH